MPRVVGILGRELMLGPDLVARATAAAARTPAERWMLNQPRAVRRSYVFDVLDRQGGEREQRIWMLLQPPAVRESYLEHVAGRQGAGPEVFWMLRQPDSVRESFVREVMSESRPRQP
jgi:hypothetical protein